MAGEREVGRQAEAKLVAEDAERFIELARRIRICELPDGTFRHWLLISIPSESPDPREAIDELIAKQRKKT